MLEQMVTSPTRGQNILDLFFTTNPTLVNKISILPRLSDHDIVLVKVNSRPEIIKQIPRDIPLYKKANWDQQKQSMRDLYTEFQSEPATTDSQAMWDKFTSRLQQGIDKHIPTRSSGTKDGFPWINQEIRRLMRKRDKLYRRWSRSGRPDDQKKFCDQKHLVRRIIGRAYEKYLKDILGLNNEEHDLESPPKVKTKKLYSLLKHSKQNPSGILVLKANAKTYTADTDKANALNAQFHSVFSPKSPISLKQLAQKTQQDLQDSVKPPPPSIPTSQHDPGMNPSFKPSPHPKMPDIQVSSNGIEKLLKGLNPHKAAGPDQLKPIVLQTLHKELAPILKLIFQKPLTQGDSHLSGKRPVYPLSLNRGTKPNQPIIGQYLWPVSSVKCLSMSWLLVFPNISQNKTFFQNCNMGSGKRGPARHNSLCLLMNCPKVCNPENKQTLSSLILVRLSTKLLTKNYY